VLRGFDQGVLDSAPYIPTTGVTCGGRMAVYFVELKRKVDAFPSDYGNVLFVSLVLR